MNDKVDNWYAPGPVKVHMMTEEERKEIEAQRKKRRRKWNKKEIAPYVCGHKSEMRDKKIKSKK